MRTNEGFKRVVRLCGIFAALSAVGLSTPAQTEEIPYMPVGPPPVITNAWRIIDKMSIALPSKPGGEEPLESPAPSQTHQALPDNHTFIPPDTQGAVGPNHLMTMLNTEVLVQNRSGSGLSTNSLAGFWTSTNIAGFDKIFDPSVVYDPFDGRWIATVAVDYSSTNSGILIGVSLTSDPTGAWNLRRVKGDTNNLVWADRPQVGFNRRWIVVQANMYNISDTNFNRSHFWVFNKTNLYAGGFSAPTFLVHDDKTAQGSYAGGEKPALIHDNTLDNIYLVQTAYGNYQGIGALRLFSISGAIGSEVLNNASSSIAEYRRHALTWTNTPPGNVDFGPQTNSTIKINNGDARMQSVLYRDGYLWCAHTVFVPAENPTRSAIQWWRIKPDDTNTLSGRIEDTSGTMFYAYPSIAVNRFADMLIGYSSFSATQYANACYSLRVFFDEHEKFRSSRIFKAGEGIYYRALTNGESVRWGDYSATVVDPANDTDFWTIQEYAAQPVGSVTNYDSGRWGTWWAKVQLAPANDHFVNAQQLSGSSTAVTNLFTRATKEAGEPEPIASLGFGSIWFNWTAPNSGFASISTNGSTFYPSLAVYTGNALTNLAIVAQRAFPNDGEGESENPNVRPLSSPFRNLFFNAASGTTYRIAVAGSSNAVGDVVLTLSQPFAPQFVTQPVGGDVIIGYNFPLLGEAIGSPAPSLQWQFNGTNITGATTTNYTIVATNVSQTGAYTLVAWNSMGTNISNEAYVKVWTTGATPLLGPVYTNSQFEFHQSDVTNYYYIVQATTNLTNWISIQTNKVPYTFTDPQATNFSLRFYRALFLGQ